jgi:hypothetical protein
VALAYLPLVWLVLRDTAAMVRTYLRPFTMAETYKLLLIYLSHGNTLRTFPPYAPRERILEQHWGYFLIDGFFALLLGTGLVLAVRHRLRQLDLLLFYFLVPPIALLGASFFYPQVYIERSMIILLPPFCILLAHGVMSLRRPRWRTVAATALLLANIIALANLWVVKRDAWTVYKPNPDWRAFARDLRKETSGTVVLTSCPTLAAQYYLKDSGSTVFWLGSDRDVDSRIVGESVRRLLRGRGIRYPHFFYVVINRYWGSRRASELNEAVFEREYPLLEKKSYFALDVYKYGFYRGTR